MNRHHHFPGFLIAIEGIDGSGKTTQAHHIQELLQVRKKVGSPGAKTAIIRTKEPTTGHWGQILRDSALTGRLSLEEEVETFIKDRKDHVESKINPELQQGSIVIVDRYYFSSMAYQGARGGVPPDEIMRRNELFAPEPDMLVILDIDPKIGLQRIRTRGDRANHFERTDTLKRAREIFKSIKKPYCYVLDGTKPVQDLATWIVNEFTCIYTEKITTSDLDPKEKLNATLSLFGGDPV